MREIKFKCWDKEVKRMSKELPIYWPIISWTDGDIDMPTDFALVKDRCIFLQYTGLKDRTGREIYEGDIVRRGTGVMAENIEVVFDRGAFIGKQIGAFTEIGGAGVAFILSGFTSEIEVIGNIYENGELLEKHSGRDL